MWSDFVFWVSLEVHNLQTGKWLIHSILLTIQLKLNNSQHTWKLFWTMILQIAYTSFGDKNPSASFLTPPVVFNINRPFAKTAAKAKWGFNSFSVFLSHASTLRGDLAVELRWSKIMVETGLSLVVRQEEQWKAPVITQISLIPSHTHTLNLPGSSALTTLCRPSSQVPCLLSAPASRLCSQAAARPTALKWVSAANSWLYSLLLALDLAGLPPSQCAIHTLPYSQFNPMYSIINITFSKS